MTEQTLSQALDRASALTADDQLRFAPVNYRLIEALAQRQQTQTAASQQLIEQRLLTLIENYVADFEASQQQGKSTLENIQQQFPAATTEAEKLFKQADFKGLQQLLTTYQRQTSAANNNSNALKDITQRLLEGHSSDEFQAEGFEQQLKQQEDESISSLSPATASHNKLGELKSIRSMRESWNKVNSPKVVDLSIKKGPENAGPLNQENLGLKSLAAMRELSPQYLNRFVTYTDTLLWLQLIADKNKKSLKKSKKKKE